KKGTNSVGGARQHCGILGNTDNCQAGVFAGYSSNKGYALLNRELYMPQKWFDEEYEDKRKKCGVPDDIIFKTKNELALEMIKKLSDSGMPHKWIGCDGAFGSDREFLDNLPKDSYYFADIHENQLVFCEKPEMILPNNDQGRGRKSKYPRPTIKPVNVKKIAEDSSISWETTCLGEGSKGPIYTKTKCLRVIRAAIGNGGVNCATPLDEVWLYIRQYENNRIKYSLCNAPTDISRDELDCAATMRWPIEQCFNECKSYLGMDHYESRSWNAWYLHMLLVIVAHFFTIIMRHTFKKDTPVLTMPMVANLIGASFTKNIDFIKEMILEVKYHLKRNYIAYKSHRKRKLNEYLAL
ncbi:MAG: IS701 family transposase, partial [Dysgonamonadaceae bacterium]|nr:IS701 family transposase [Dysgonamonadaceae bacterium]